jgi:hypothetical protein
MPNRELFVRWDDILDSPIITLGGVEYFLDWGAGWVKHDGYGYCFDLVSVWCVVGVDVSACPHVAKVLTERWDEISPMMFAIPN